MVADNWRNKGCGKPWVSHYRSATNGIAELADKKAKQRIAKQEVWAYWACVSKAVSNHRWFDFTISQYELKFIPSTLWHPPTNEKKKKNGKKKTSAKHCQHSTMLCSLLTAYKKIEAEKCEQKQHSRAFVPRGVPVSKTETYIKRTQLQQTHILLRKSNVLGVFARRREAAVWAT